LPNESQYLYLLLMRHGPREHTPLVPERRQSLSELGASAAREAAGALAELRHTAAGGDAVSVGLVVCGTYEPVACTAQNVRAVFAAHSYPAPRWKRGECFDPHRFWPEAGTRPKAGEPAQSWPDQGAQPVAAGASSEGGESAASTLPVGWEAFATENGSARTPAVADALYSDLTDLEDRGNAVLVVGHQPQLSWIAEEISGRAEVIESAEVICLRVTKRGDTRPRWFRRHRWRLVWAITPTKVDETATPELREKIKSKMQVAQLLGTVIAAALGWIASTLKYGDAPPSAVTATLGELLLQRRWLLSAGTAVALLVALWLYLATMYAYDLLLMPKRFWSESRSGSGWRSWWVARRPPSSATRVLHGNMLHVWRYMFTPATGALVVALLLFTLARLLPDRPLTAGPVSAAGITFLSTSPWTLGATAAALVIVCTAGVLHWLGRPALGSQA
jgi:phosphohistidine phosphatase SixA